VTAASNSGWSTGKRAFAALSVVVAGLLVFIAWRALHLPASSAGAIEVAPAAQAVTARPLGVTDPLLPGVTEVPCEGQLALRGGDYPKAYAVFSRRAGIEPAAAFHLGEMYRDGLGVARNTGFAVRTFKQAADAGHAGAMLALAQVFERGEDGFGSYPDARVWFEKAALRGNESAQRSLVSMHAEGLGGDRDAVAALSWLTLVADGYTGRGEAVPEDVSALRSQLERDLDSKKKAAVVSAAEQLQKRLAVELAQHPGEPNPCEP
jgi:hypothetical protein